MIETLKRKIHGVVDNEDYNKRNKCKVSKKTHASKIQLTKKH